jgi:hypothetical protein
MSSAINLQFAFKEILSESINAKIMNGFHFAKNNAQQIRKICGCIIFAVRKPS